MKNNISNNQSGDFFISNPKFLVIDFERYKEQGTRSKAVHWACRSVTVVGSFVVASTRAVSHKCHCLFRFQFLDLRCWVSSYSFN